jgi:hypothetical protein
VFEKTMHEVLTRLLAVGDNVSRLGSTAEEPKVC